MGLKHGRLLQRLVCIIILCVVFMGLLLGLAVAQESYRFERMWPTLMQPWYFSGPTYVAIDSDGFVYVADTCRHHIQKFNLDGQFITKWGSEGSGDGQFNRLCGIATDANGFVYVADSQNHRIQKFTSDGLFISKWGTPGNGDGQFSCPYGIATDDSGFVYVTDIYNHRVQKFTSEGLFVAKWGTWGGESYNTHDIIIDSDGFVYAGSWDGGESKFHNPHGIATDSNGFVYVADNQNHRIQKFTSDGQFVAKWGSWGSDEGQFQNPHGIAADVSGFVYVADSNNHRVQKFTSDGQFMAEWESYGNGYKELDCHYPMMEGYFYWSYGIAVDASGFIYVGNDRIQKFTSDGQFVAKWGSSGNEDGYFDKPSRISLDVDGFVYVSDTGNDRTQKFTSDGQFISKWENSDSSDEQFDFQSMPTDTYGFISFNCIHIIQSFTDAPSIAMRIGEAGSGPGMFYSPDSLYISSDGRLYISDSGNNRIQVLKPILSTDKKTKAIILAGGGPYPGNGIWNATQMSANFAHRAMTYQGLTNDEIYYLSAGTEDNEYVDAPATKANLRQAITEWAADADDLVIYLTDHGGQNVFRLNSQEILFATELDSWLDKLQRELPGKVSLVYDACHAGSFISSLTSPSGKDRIVMASSGADEYAYFISQGTISFSSYFWPHIFNGRDMEEAFTTASRAMGGTAGFQHPLVDANGDGIPNESEDFDLLRNLYVGNGTFIEAEPPKTTSVSPPITINGTSSALIYASGVTDKDGVARVWAVIRPPNYRHSSSNSPVIELPSLDLLPVGDDRYENTYNGFHVEGTYKIAIYARDALGNTSEPIMTTITVVNPLKRKAVIVGSPSQSHEMWPAVEKNMRLAHEALKSQGYPDEDIYFLSPVTFSTGVDGLAAKSNLDYALGDWGNDHTYELLLYMIGDAQDGNFQINDTETLSPEELDTHLDQLQEILPGKVTVIYDACGSGTFLSALTPDADKERILIASTSGDQCPSFLEQGTLSFSFPFWKEVIEGATVRDAFVEAKRVARYFGRRFHAEQIPGLDDNGNGIFNETEDGSIAKSCRIGEGIQSEMSVPLIQAISPSQVLNGETSATLYVEDVTTLGLIENVLALIIPPSFGNASLSQPVMDLPTLELMPVGNGRYEGTYHDFSLSGTYQIVICAVDADGGISFKETQIEQTVDVTSPEDPLYVPGNTFTHGVFTVGESGVIEFEWLYDGGMYEGELGIFSLSGMEDMTPGSEEFIRKAAQRALSDGEAGDIVLSDSREKARFSGSLGGESQDWNSGIYTGLRRLSMNPGDTFALILVPNGSLQNFSDHPETTNPDLRPLFSMTASNSAYGMSAGQIADVNGTGSAFVMEDMNAPDSDMDFNDLVFRISGATVNAIQELDAFMSPQIQRKQDRRSCLDWRTETETGRQIMSHLELSEINPDALRLFFAVAAPVDLLIYDTQGNVIGKEGGRIPGAVFGIDEQGHPFVSLAASEPEVCHLILRSASDQTCNLEIRTYQGDEMLSEETKTLDINAHSVLKAEIITTDDMGITVEEPKMPTSPEGTPLPYDFDGDGKIDDSDIKRVSSIWNTAEGDPEYDPFYDFDDDGWISVLDIMTVVNWESGIRN